jgi:hypothetical protein
VPPVSGLPGGFPGGAPPVAAAGFSSGMPGGMSGSPGGLAAPPLAPLTLLAPLPGAMQAGALAIAGGGLAGAAVPMAARVGGPAAPAPFSSAPGGGVPGEGMQLPLPEGQAPAQGVVPGLWGPPAPAPRHLAPAPPRRPVAPAPRERDVWPGVVPERDLAQRAGDRLYPLVESIRDSRAGWIGVLLLFGLTGPIVLLRLRIDVRVRLVLAALVFFMWLGLISDLL